MGRFSFAFPMDFYQTLLQNSGASIDKQGNHLVCWMSPELFRSLPIDNWKFNRPPDLERVKEIREHMNVSKRVDGILYLAFLDKSFVCYDANHRRLAMEGVEGLHNVLVDILFDVTDKDVEEEFIRLNKAHSVPELYMERELAEKRVEMETLVREFCENYKAHVSSSKRPLRPNFNRDHLTDEFTRIMREKRMTHTEFVEWITARNRELSLQDRSDLPEKLRTKCEKSGLWLFAWSSSL